MIGVHQTVLTVPGGNCFEACIASLLEVPIDAVPYFATREGRELVTRCRRGQP